MNDLVLGFNVVVQRCCLWKRCVAVHVLSDCIFFLLLVSNLLHSLITLFNIHTPHCSIYKPIKAEGGWWCEGGGGTGCEWIIWIQSMIGRTLPEKKHTAYRWIRWLLVGLLKGIFEVKKCTIYEIIHLSSQQAFWCGMSMLIWLPAPMLDI